jgi:uncharacterized protein YeaO (DUF488 family)
MIRLKRAYEQPSKEDGYRVLVDRLWPRGLTKEKASIDLWLKEVAPSVELRKWFSHDDSKWGEFSERYRKELDDNTDNVRRLIELSSGQDITLIFSARDVEHNSAVILRDYLIGMTDGSSRSNISAKR